MVANRDLISRRHFVSQMLIGSLTGSLVLGGLDIPAAHANANLKSGKMSGPEIKDHDRHIRDAVSKAKDFERDYADDIFLPIKYRPLLSSIFHRLTRLQRLVGYANFNLIGFDAALKCAKAYSSVGAFSKQEIALIEALFLFDATNYGFFGKKVSHSLTDKITLRDVKKIHGTGHYLYQGDALKLYAKLKKQLGDSLILTSGIRSVVKQLHLFIAKAENSGGNLSRAARSLAPPGHSFHGIGDFDVGQKGLGAANFTSAFERTEIHKRLIDLGLIVERYPKSNPFGVRHEPWHIKVVSHV